MNRWPASHSLALGIALASSPVLSSAQTIGSTPEQYELTAEGRVPPERIPHLVDCLMDYFDTNEYRLTGNNTLTRQQRRANGWRVDMMDRRLMHRSAEILDDGTAKLHEAKWLIVNITTREKKGFVKCVDDNK